MSKYSFEDDLVLRKAEIAKLQLKDAIDLFLERKWISAITLAGAAEEIFARLLNLRGEISAAEEIWKHIEEVRSATGLPYAGTRSKQDAFREWNEKRNALKHHNKADEDQVTFSAFDAAFEMINRANNNGDRLGVVASNRQDYENWCIENIFLIDPPPLD